jgi:hypothetical protein
MKMLKITLVALLLFPNLSFGQYDVFHGFTLGWNNSYIQQDAVSNFVDDYNALRPYLSQPLESPSGYFGGLDATWDMAISRFYFGVGFTMRRHGILSSKAMINGVEETRQFKLTVHTYRLGLGYIYADEWGTVSLGSRVEIGSANFFTRRAASDEIRSADWIEIPSPVSSLYGGAVSPFFKLSIGDPIGFYVEAYYNISIFSNNIHDMWVIYNGVPSYVYSDDEKFINNQAGPGLSVGLYCRIAGAEL